MVYYCFKSNTSAVVPTKTDFCVSIYYLSIFSETWLQFAEHFRPFLARRILVSNHLRWGMTSPLAKVLPVRRCQRVHQLRPWSEEWMLLPGQQNLGTALVCSRVHICCRHMIANGCLHSLWLWTLPSTQIHLLLWGVCYASAQIYLPINHNMMMRLRCWTYSSR